MNRSGILILFVILFAGCDPVYHLDYVVTNNSGEKIWLHCMDEDSAAIRFIPLENGRSDTIIQETGVGYAKPVFEEKRKNFRARITFSTDSAFTTDRLFVPASDWNYFEDGKTEGIAELIVSKNDLDGK